MRSRRSHATSLRLSRRSRPDGSRRSRHPRCRRCALEARRVVASRGLFVRRRSKQRGLRRERREPLSAADLALGLRILGDLLESGLPVTRALHAFDDLAPRAWRGALPRDHAIGARRKEPRRRARRSAARDPAARHRHRAGGRSRRGHRTGDSSRRGSQRSHRRDAGRRFARRSRIRWSSRSPASPRSRVLITVVLPRFAKILADLGQTLPASTQIVLHVADVGRAALVPGPRGGRDRRWRCGARGSRPTAAACSGIALLLAVPVVGAVRRGAATARMAHSLAALLESGVPIATAMGHAARATGDAELEARLTAARATDHRRPVAVAGARGESTRRVKRRFGSSRAGEESGRLPSMLSHAAKIEQTARRSDREDGGPHARADPAAHVRERRRARRRRVAPGDLQRAADRMRTQRRGVTLDRAARHAGRFSASSAS